MFSVKLASLPIAFLVFIWNVPCCAAQTVPSSLPAEIRRAMSAVSKDNLSRTVNVLAREFGPRNAYFNQPFRDDKCTPETSITYPENNVIMAAYRFAGMLNYMGYMTRLEPIRLDFTGKLYGYNVVAEKTGAIYPHSFIEVGGHLDSRPQTPGAADNAIGIAAVIELARILANYPNSYSLRFIAFVGHEHFYFQNIGSTSHISTTVDNGDKIKAGLVLDGIGVSEEPPTATSVIIHDGSRESAEIADLYCFAAKTFAIPIKCRIAMDNALSVGSDNLSYWMQKQPATLNVGAWPYKQPFYHDCGDLPDIVNYENAMYTVQLNLALIILLDNGVTPPAPAAATPER